MARESGESVFDFKIGPAFIAVLVSMALSFAQFMYSQGQQAAVNENTKHVTERLEQTAQRQADKQNSLNERIIKVETIVSTVQSGLQSIEAKIDRIAQNGKLDKN